MYIDTRIPYEPGGKLGTAYNRAMETVEDWVLFLDHDVLMVNPLWYEIALKAIQTYGHKAGFITARTNRIGCSLQRVFTKPVDDIKYHIGVAKQLYGKHKGQVIDVTAKGQPFSGFFILTHKKAWEDAGGFAKKFLGADTQYCGAIKKAGYSTYVLMDLYCYHAYQRNHKTHEFTL